MDIRHAGWVVWLSLAIGCATSSTDAEWQARKQAVYDACKNRLWQEMVENSHCTLGNCDEKKWREWRVEQYNKLADGSCQFEVSNFVAQHMVVPGNVGLLQHGYIM